MVLPHSPIHSLLFVPRFVYYLVPTHYVLEGLVMTQFHDDVTQVTTVMHQQVSAEEFVTDHFGGAFSYDNRWKDLGVLLAYIAFTRLATLLVLRFVRHVHR